MQRTLARSFDDYADDLTRAPSKGDVADQAAEEIVAWCRAQAVQHRKDAEHCQGVADRYAEELQ